MWKWPKYYICYFLAFGLLWLFWQLFLDELAGLVREHIPEGGIIMYSVTHPYIIMPSLIVLTCLSILLYRFKSKVKGQKKDIEIKPIPKSEKLSDTLTQMHWRLVELQKEKRLHTRVSLNQLDKASWIFLDKLGLVPLSDKRKYLLQMKREIQKRVPQPRIRQKFSFTEWARYRAGVKEQGIIVALDLQRTLVASRKWTLADATKMSEWLDDYGWGVKKLRDNDSQWGDLWKSISDFTKDSTLRKLVDAHLNMSYVYNNVCLMNYYSERLGNRKSFLGELHVVLVGSPISPEKAELALSEILEKIEYSLAKGRFYFKYRSYDLRLLSLPPEPTKFSLSLELMTSNQDNIPRGISEISLEIQKENGDKKEFKPVKTDGVTKDIINLHLKPNEPKTIPLYFVVDEKPVLGSERLYVVDDRGNWSCIPINVDTMSTMAKKSKSRSGDYQIL